MRQPVCAAAWVPGHWLCSNRERLQQACLHFPVPHCFPRESLSFPKLLFDPSGVVRIGLEENSFPAVPVETAQNSSCLKARVEMRLRSQRHEGSLWAPHPLLHGSQRDSVGCHT